MMPSLSQLVYGSAVLMHALFAAGEIFPLSSPLILEKVIKRWPKKIALPDEEGRMVAMIVHNAVVYNAIIAAALLAAAFAGKPAIVVQATLLAGGLMAGIVGAFTLSPLTIVQAIVCGLALIFKTGLRVV